MAACPTCATPLPEDSRFCPRCGSSVESAISADGPTRTVFDSPVTPRSAVSRRTEVTSAGRLAVSEAGSAARFVSGQILLDRYRVVGLIGRGGMGEVYRADDLKLDQPVALKFLPVHFAEDRGRLDRFYGEVRIARQVSHPNVARVYDVGEIEGQTFLSMEYIDGEDLGTLLRRIGRIPGERGVEIAREICAGLAAAHDRGVLHRDLKPANVMIDARGRARITDFGLASVLGEQTPADVRSGTPHYMAPEQLEGREVSVRSDLYALGLVLYEVFTGKRAREAGSLAELMRLHQDSTPAHPSSYVADLDPLVERVILQCLERNPEDRPLSALAVAAALPGGDPLAAALAAGEMPSPEAVAAAGGAGALRPWIAAACVAFVLGGMLLYAAVAPRASLLGRLGVGKPPEALVDRAQEVARRLGHTAEPVDRAWRYGSFADVWFWITEEPARRPLLRPGGPTVVHFWYRESPARFEPRATGNAVTADDPPMSTGGMLRVQLDTDGRLRGFLSVPRREPSEEAAPRRAPDWRPALEAAGLRDVALTPRESRWRPPVYADTRAAWDGTWPGTEVPLRVEAAGLDGRIVWFVAAGPWARPDATDVGQPRGRIRIGLILNVVFIVGALAAACWVARANLKAGRGDRRGALRIAGWTAGVTALAVWLNANHAPDVQAEWGTLQESVALALFFGAFVWVLYLALEPFVRRHAPGSLIGWTRLLQGRWRDPRIGRDLLAGAVAGVALLVCLNLTYLIADALGIAGPEPYRPSFVALLGARFIVVTLLNILLGATASSLVLLFFFSLGYLGFRVPWPGRLIFFSFTALMTFLFREGGHPAMTLAYALLAATVITVVYAKFGVLAAFGMQIFAQWSLPLSLDPAVWYAPTMLFATAVLVLLLGIAAWVAAGGALRRLGT